MSILVSQLNIRTQEISYLILQTKVWKQSLVMVPPEQNPRESLESCLSCSVKRVDFLPAEKKYSCGTKI